jgi:hypothetical protein
MEKSIEETNRENVLTCVYCGTAYPPGTPTHGSPVLTEHIKVCSKHPLRAAEEKIKKLREALIGLVGASDRKELEGMEAQMRLFAMNGSVPKTDAINSINAIHAILETE